MNIRHAAAVTACLAGLGTVTTPANAQEYPFRPIEMVVTFGPGGGADLFGRQMARMLEPRLDVAMPVSNVAGASGNAGLTRLRTSPADGYTMGTLISLTVASWAGGLGDSSVDDFDMIAIVQSSPSFLFLPANSQYKTAEELFQGARDNPGKITIATSGYGTQDDVTLKILARNGIEMRNVPFQAPSERYAAPLGNHTVAIYEEPGDVAHFLEAGQLVPVVVFDTERHPSFPEVPTSGELGIEIAGLDNFRALALPAGTDPAVRDKLTAATLEVIEDPAWQEFCTKTYSCTPPITGDEASQTIREFHDTVLSFLEE